MSFWDKYCDETLTLKEQKEALTKPNWSYWFALKNIPGSNLQALQEKACENSVYAYKFARDIPGADTKHCQEFACKYTYYAYLFAIYIPGADKEYCFKHAFPEKEFGPDRWKSEYKKFIMQKACE